MKWEKICYTRLLIDNHISEADPSSLKKFDPKEYVTLVKRGGVDAAMIYACCHNGNCYYPTKIGHMHKNLNGRDMFGEIISRLRKEGITPLAYCSVIYHNDAAKTHPNWRFKRADGVQHSGRYWLCCPNNLEYREFTKKQLAEIIAYDVEGIFIDMTFWPDVCVCHNCRERYLKETGKEIPSVINWDDEEWINFQRSRERWLTEFAKELTNSIKRIKPEMSVVHQCSPVIHGWCWGQSPDIYDASDYTSGDFYGGRDQQRLGTKIMAAFSKRLPYEYMTSICVNLPDHTSIKSEDEMVCESATTLANAGAHLFIDAINPNGTLSEKVYERLGRVMQRIKPFREKVKQLNPTLVADTAIYFSMASNMNDRFNGVKLEKVWASGMNPMQDLPMRDEMTGTSIILNRAKILYRVITSKTTDFTNLKTIIMNNVRFMSKEETERIHNFVYNGGTLIATGLTSYNDISGKTSGDFALKDVFGVSYTGKKTKSVNYLYLLEKSEYLLCNQPAPIVNVTSATVLGKIAEPIFEPYNAELYASIHSNPPGPISEYPGLTINTFGKGKCIYLYSSLFSLQQAAQQSFGEWFFKKYIDSEINLSSNAPPSVEITLLKSATKNSFLVCFVNYQKELPNVPVHNLSTTLRLPRNFKPQTCCKVSDNKKIDFEFKDNKITFELPVLETIEMIEIE